MRKRPLLAQVELCTQAQVPSTQAPSAHMWNFMHICACTSLLQPDFEQAKAWWFGTPAVEHGGMIVKVYSPKSSIKVSFLMLPRSTLPQELSPALILSIFQDFPPESGLLGLNKQF